MESNNLINTESGVLPFSLEAEQAVIGSVLIEPAVLSDISDSIKPEYFYLPQHQSIFKVMWEMNFYNKPIDAVTVLNELKNQGIYDDAGGKEYLIRLADMVPSASNIESYVSIIREKYNIRSVILAARDIINDASKDDVDSSSLLDSAEKRIFDIRQDKESEGLVHIRDVIIDETMVRLDKITREEFKEEFQGIPSGISALDRYTTGFHKSDLIILGARPGMGKTSLALNFARNVAVTGKKTVAFFSLEMTREQLVERLLANEASVESTKMRTGQLDNDEWLRIIQATELLSNTNIYLDETSTITVNTMKTRLRRMKKKPDLVVIDYLGLMKNNNSKYDGNRVNEISEITRNLKVMAKELMVPVICCAQLSRGTEVKGKSHRPALADLRDSGSIEQDADIVLFIYRENYYANESEAPDDIDINAAECIVAKNRHGEVGTAHLRWDPQFTRYTTAETNLKEN